MFKRVEVNVEINVEVSFEVSKCLSGFERSKCVNEVCLLSNIGWDSCC